MMTIAIVLVVAEYYIYLKQPPEAFYENRCSLELRKIHRKTPEKAEVEAWNLTKKRDSGTGIFQWILQKF